MRLNLSTEQIAQALADELAQPPEPHQTRFKRWRPKLNKTQSAIYDCQARFILAYGERGSGKTYGAIEKMVRHCYSNKDALAIIIVGVKRQAEEGGVWDKLQRQVLPKWELALGFDPGSQIRFYTEPKTNVAKDIFIWIRNKHGGWSRILLLSMPVHGHVADRVKGMEPSFLLVDEAQTLESDVYFTSLIQQLGRRPGIEDIQQAIYCANPAGPSHWLYQRFFIRPVNPETGDWDVRYAVFHVPFNENAVNMPSDYLENVKEAVRGDEIEAARMLRGEWVDRPTGEALFGEVFMEEIHMKGDAIKGIGIQPVMGHSVCLSYDLGAAHSSIHFMQVVPTVEKMYKLYFDELNFVGQYMPYFKLVPLLIERMQYWDRKMNGKAHFVHISDNSAFNQYRAATGSFDVWDIEQLSSDYVAKHKLPEKYIVRLKECPKGPHSVEARVRLVQDGLRAEEILISATLTKTKEMMMRLEQDDKEAFKPKRSPYLHVFDSFTYAPFYFSLGKSRLQLHSAPVEPPQSYSLGQGKPVKSLARV